MVGFQERRVKLIMKLKEAESEKEKDLVKSKLRGLDRDQMFQYEFGER